MSSTIHFLIICVFCKDPMVAKGLECLKEASSNLNNMYCTALSFYTFTLAGDQDMRKKLISNLDSQAKREGAI